MSKEFCMTCKKPIDHMDFYYTYPNGKICSACILKQEYGMEEHVLPVGKEGDKEALRQQKKRTVLFLDQAVNGG